MSGAAAAAHAPVEVKIKPGEQTFDYETLKGERLFVCGSGWCSYGWVTVQPGKQAFDYDTLKGGWLGGLGIVVMVHCVLVVLCVCVCVVVGGCWKQDAVRKRPIHRPGLPTPPCPAPAYCQACGWRAALTWLTRRPT